MKVKFSNMFLLGRKNSLEHILMFLLFHHVHEGQLLFRYTYVSGGQVLKNRVLITSPKSVTFTIDDKTDVNYEVCGIVHHYGRSVTEGHYTALCKHEDK